MLPLVLKPIADVVTGAIHISEYHPDTQMKFLNQGKKNIAQKQVQEQTIF